MSRTRPWSTLRGAFVAPLAAVLLLLAAGGCGGPEPVGANTRVWRRARMGGQPRAWARVGEGKVAANHSSTAGWKGIPSSSPEGAAQAAATSDPQ